MSGVRNYVRGARDEDRRSTPPPPSTQPLPLTQPHQRASRIDRASALGLKVKRGESKTVNVQPFGQQLPNAPPPQGYRAAFNQMLTSRETFSHPFESSVRQPAPAQGVGLDRRLEEQQHEGNPIQGGAFDDTMTSGFDDTKSDLTYNGYTHGMDDYGEGYLDKGGYGRQDEAVRDQQVNQDRRQQVRSNGRSSPRIKQHGLQHKQSRSPLVDAEPDQQPNSYLGQPKQSIIGRFHAATDERWQQDIPPHNSTVLGASMQVNTSSKNDHFDEPEYEDDDEYARHQQRMDREGLDGSEEENYDEDSPEEGTELPEHQDNGNGHPEEEGECNRFEPRSDGAVTQVSAVSRRPRRDELDEVLRARNADKSRFELDHEDSKLATMAYADLKKEAWDREEPGSQKRAASTQTQNTEFTSKDYFIYMVQEGDTEGLFNFFQDMPMAEYEETGDHFIEKFSELMKQIKDARKKKRDIVTAFENEIEAREKAVRGKSGFLEQKFETMRAGGESVLRSKV